MCGNINLLLTEREGRTGEYWHKVVTVRTEHREVRTKTTEGQYSTVRLEQARLVISLLYGTRLLPKRTSGQLKSEDFRRVMAYTWATQKEQATTTLKKKSLNIIIVTIINNYYSFKISSRFLLVKTTRTIHHNQLLSTKFGKNFVILNQWLQNDVKKAASSELEICRILHFLLSLIQ